MTLEELQNEVLRMQNEAQQKDARIAELEKQNTEKDARITSLQEHNQQLFIRCTNPAQNDNKPKQKTIGDIAKELRGKH